MCLFSLQILFRFLYIVHKLLNSQTEFRNIVNAEDLDTSVFIFDCLLFPYFLFDVFSPFDPLSTVAWESGEKHGNFTVKFGNIVIMPQ